jgi:polyphosphate kinase 2 (PPK2 family)
MLYASTTQSLLIIFQALDAAGKDGTIKHVISGVNPQGCEVHSFKSPSSEELRHDYLWRTTKALPERGRIGIFKILSQRLAKRTEEALSQTNRAKRKKLEILGLRYPRTPVLG